MASRKERRLRSLQRLEQQQGAAVTTNKSLTITGMAFQGPMPPPQMLAEYNDIVPNGAERIFVVFEKQVDHRIRQEDRVIAGNERRADRGLLSGLTIGVVGLVVAGWAITTGHDVAGAAIAGVDLVSLVGTFIYGTNSRRAEREEKAKALGGRR